MPIIPLSNSESRGKRGYRFPEMKPKEKVSVKYGPTPKIKRIKPSNIGVPKVKRVTPGATGLNTIRKPVKVNGKTVKQIKSVNEAYLKKHSDNIKKELDEYKERHGGKEWMPTPKIRKPKPKKRTFKNTKTMKMI